MLTRTTVTPTRSRLRRALAAPARRLLEHAVAASQAERRPLWAVGGAVRDLAAGLPLRDVDLALPAASAGELLAFAQDVAHRAGGQAELRSAGLGTASVNAGGTRIDLAALRTERYARPGALPDARLGASIEADLARRDFTVNALALALAGPSAGALLDPYGGRHDLARRHLRVLHERSFIDDATRLWRGARTAASLRLRPEPLTAALIADGARWLGRISGERLYAELRLTGDRPYAYHAIRLLDEWGMLRGTHEAFRLAPESARALRYHPGPHPVERLAAVLLAPLPGRDAVLDRLRAPRDVRDAVQQAVSLLAAGWSRHHAPEALEPLAVATPPAREAARWLDPARQRPFQRALGRWERTRPPLDARALMAMGVAEGPALGRLLHCLRRERYLGNLKDAAAARRIVERQIAKGRAG